MARRPTPRFLHKLQLHPFVIAAFRQAASTQKVLGDKSPFKVEPAYDRDPNEHEFYLIGVGHEFAELLTCFEHLEHIPLFIANYRETPSMQKAGINRSKYIIYHIENYLIRTQGLYDRVLKLVNAVFHLLNEPQNCRANVVLNNVKVKITKVPAAVKRLRKLLDQYAKTRHMVVHQGSIKDDRLRMLEFYYILDEMREQKDTNVSEIKAELTQMVIIGKRQEFIEFNQHLYDDLVRLLDTLHPHYKREAKRLNAIIDGRL